MRTKPFGVALWIWGIGFLVGAAGILAFSPGSAKSRIAYHSEKSALEAKLDESKSKSVIEAQKINIRKAAIKCIPHILQLARYNAQVENTTNKLEVTVEAGPAQLLMLALAEAKQKSEQAWKDYWDSLQLLKGLEYFRGGSGENDPRWMYSGPVDKFEKQIYVAASSAENAKKYFGSNSPKYRERKIELDRLEHMAMAKDLDAIMQEFVSD